MAAVELPSNEAETDLIIRRATNGDIPALSLLGSKLIKQHQSYDTQRFTVFEPLAENYAQFLAEQIENDSAIVLVAVLGGDVCGYAFVRVEPDSFLEALAEAAWLHDIYVEDTARGANIGKRLLQAAMIAARELGSSCLMLSASPHNKIAQALFQQAGFRPTMLEMRCDFEAECKTMAISPNPTKIKPPFTAETARAKVRAAEDAWNSRDPERVALAYTPDSEWRNRAEFFTGREAIKEFLRRKWARELDYRLMKELWAFTDNRISVRFEYEWHDTSGQWFRTHGNEHWEFDDEGLMRRRDMSANEYPIAESARRYRL